MIQKPPGYRTLRLAWQRVLPACGRSFTSQNLVYIVRATPIITGTLVADVAESADALDSKSGIREDVWVRPPPSAPIPSHRLGGSRLQRRPAANPSKFPDFCVASRLPRTIVTLVPHPFSQVRNRHEKGGQELGSPFLIFSPRWRPTLQSLLGRTFLLGIARDGNG